jgi:hypothetical protein
MRVFSAAFVSFSIVTTLFAAACKGGPGDPEEPWAKNQTVTGSDVPNVVGVATPASTQGSTTTDNATAIWPTDATALKADSPGGGFTTAAPKGSTCTLGEDHYTLDLKTLAFTSKRCAPKGKDAPQDFVSTSRTLTAVEYMTIDEAMKSLTITTEAKSCGADKPELGVTVTSPRGDKAYYDDFYICRNDGKTYVAHIDGVFDALNKLAPIPAP